VAHFSKAIFEKWKDKIFKGKTFSQLIQLKDQKVLITES